MQGQMTVTREYIEERINNWESRINSLFDEILQWISEKPEWSAERGDVMQRHEHLMREYEVSPRKLPSLALHSGKAALRFVPSALWVIGANGRLNITTNTKQYILVDTGGKNGDGSNWRLADPEMRLAHTPFDKEALFEILDEN